MEPSTPQERAEQLRQRHRGRWLVIWSEWDSRYLAFPIWIGSGGGMVAAKSGTELERRMALVEQSATSNHRKSKRGPAAQGGF